MHTVMQSPQDAPLDVEEEQNSTISWHKPDSHVPAGMEMVRGGTDSNCEELFVGRGRYKDGLHPGTFRAGNSTMNISWGGYEITVADYELLYARPSSVQWIRLEGRLSVSKIESDGFVPMVAGNESDGRPLYVIQAFHDKGVYCGKIREKGIAFLPHEGEEIMASIFNIMVVFKAHHKVNKARFRTMHEPDNWGKLQNQPGNAFTRLIPILTKSSSPSRIAVLLDNIDLSERDYCWRINSFVDNISLDGFCAHINTWSTSVLYGAGISSMQIESTDPDFRCGVDTTRGAASTKRVSFDWHYEKTPVVFVALSGFDLGQYPCISIKADNIDCTGFDLEVTNTWENTKIYTVSTTWIAFPENRSVIQYGSVHAVNGKTVGSVTFSPAFDRRPTVLAGFTRLNTNRANIRLHIEVENVTHMGMDWKIQTWENSRIDKVDVNYIAFV